MPSAFLAIAFLAILIIPNVAAKLKLLHTSEFFFKVSDTAPACLPSGMCFVFRSSGHVDPQPSGYRVPFSIRGIDNVYELASLIDGGTLSATLAFGEAAGQAVTIVPHYASYTNSDEVERQITASLQLSEFPDGHGLVVFGERGNQSASRPLELRRDSRRGGIWAEPRAATAANILVIVLLIATGLIEARTTEASLLGRIEFSVLVVARLLGVAIAKDTFDPIQFTLFVAAMLLPWLALIDLLQRYLANRFATVERSFDRIERVLERICSRPAVAQQPLLTFLTLASALGLFAYCLWFSDSFRWSIFEERDFLEARQLASHWTFPIYGPQLLAGGATPGGGLYVLLTPVVALWNDPQIMHLLNQLLFLAMPLMAWWTLREREPAGALFAAFAIVSSQLILALSYWPIHPNFSLAVAFLYAHAIIRGAVDGHKGWLIASGLLLGILTQLHFSYFLLVPCHIVLVVGGNLRNTFLKSVSVTAVFVPLLPYLIVESLHHFPNLRQIVTMPRFHREYVPSSPMANTNTLALTMEWVRQLPGLFAERSLQLVALMFGVGIGSAMFAVAGRRGSRMTLSVAAAALFCIPLLGLTLLGMGYSARHTISIVPGLFLLAGVGFGAAMRMLPSAVAPTSALIVLALVAASAWRATDSTRLTAVTRQQGEWAVDYRQREAIAHDLITRLGVTPDIYQSRAFWWWLGFSISPEVFSETYRKLTEGKHAQRSLGSDDYVLVTRKDLPLFLSNTFDVHDSQIVGGMYVHRATPKEDFRKLPPSGNADTGVRLHPFLRQVDLIRQRQSGFVRIGQQRAGSIDRNLFLGILAEGRLKILVTTEHESVGKRSRLRWCVDSPSLNGHYQEIKTIWRPRLILESAARVPSEISLARDVLGSLLYKTPQCGEAWAEGEGFQRITFAADGVFDQSFMSRPELSVRTWQLDQAPPFSNALLDREAISDWMSSRFKPMQDQPRS